MSSIEVALCDNRFKKEMGIDASLIFRRYMSDDVTDLSLHPRLRWRRDALLGATMATLGLYDLARGRYLSFYGALGLPTNNGHKFKRSI